jgi:hypothetical protein
LLCELHRGTWSLSGGSDGVGDGSAGRSTVAGAWAVAGTPFARRTPAILCSGEVESARGRTAEASAGFIDAGAGRGHGRGLAWRGVGRWACSGAFRARRTRVGVLLPIFKSLLRSQTCESWQKSGAGLHLAPRAVSCM